MSIFFSNICISLNHASSNYICHERLCPVFMLFLFSLFSELNPGFWTFLLRKVDCNVYSVNINYRVSQKNFIPWTYRCYRVSPEQDVTKATHLVTHLCLLCFFLVIIRKWKFINFQYRKTMIYLHNKDVLTTISLQPDCINL